MSITDHRRHMNIITFNKRHFGFINESSTQDALNTFINYIQINKKTNHKTILVTKESTEAFDSV